MTDQPKRRGRPPNAERLVAVVSSPDAYPLPRLRWKHIEGAKYPGVPTLQQAWQHPTGIQWRPLPVVGADANDWEDS